MKKCLREKLINLNGEKVVLLANQKDYDGVIAYHGFLVIRYKCYGYFKPDSKLRIKMLVSCIVGDVVYRVPLNCIVDVERF